MGDGRWAAFGLEGALPEGVAPAALVDEGLGPSTEVWAYRAGIKPVVFVTVREEEVERTVARFSGAHVERRDRRVLVGDGDRWTDDRRRGEPRVELYIAADPGLAVEAAELQTEDPTRAARRLGELMGYPACCVEAFVAQRDRSDNTRNRYETAARTKRHPWCFELNNLSAMVVPFFPCSYVCARATDFARRTLSAFRHDDADAARRTEELLRRPALYFAHERLVCFDASASSATSIDYDRVLVPRRAPRNVVALARALGAGDRLELDDERLRVTRAGDGCFELRRIDRSVGFVAPFT